MLTVPAAQVAARSPLRCHVAKCKVTATQTPILCIALLGGEHVSRVRLPARVCSDHLTTFAERFLTPERRAQMEASLRSHGHGSPDWARTHVEFVVDD